MSLARLWARIWRQIMSKSQVRRAAAPRTRAPRRPTFRPRLEGLEDRLTPSVTTINVTDNADVLDNPANVTASTLVTDNQQGQKVSLRDAINAANNTGGAGNTYVINLQATNYDLTATDNNWYGPNGLPAITSNITIMGAPVVPPGTTGTTIGRDLVVGENAPDFRLFYVAGKYDGLAAGDLTLENLTLENGLAQGGNSGSGGGGLGAGGAVFNQGTLNLSGVTLTGNEAVGGSSGETKGGSGGGGIGQDAQGSNGGGFGGNFPVTFGGAGGLVGAFSGSVNNSAGGGGGFGTQDFGVAGSSNGSGAGGGTGALGGAGGSRGQIGLPPGAAGDGGGGGSPDTQSNQAGGDGGAFGNGGTGASGAGGGGGVGGGGGGGGSFGGSGGGGFGGGGGAGIFAGGDGGFGGGGGGGGSVAVGGDGGLGVFGGGNGGTTGGGGGGAGMGGAIFNMFGNTTATNCTLTANTAQGGAGAGSPANFAGGNGSGYGGAVFNLDGTLNLTYCTVADNTVAAGSGGAPKSGAADGGAVYNLAYGNKITDGSAQSAAAVISDSILSNSTGGTDLVNNSDTSKNVGDLATVRLGVDLVMSSNGTIGGATPLTADPRLLPLANNGGPTQTMALQAGSPAIGPGTPGVTTDQRGETRPITQPPNGTSLGAYEYNPVVNSPVATTTTISNVQIESDTANPGSYEAVVTVNVGPNVNAGTVSVKVASKIFNLPIGETDNVPVQNGQATVTVPLKALSYLDQIIPDLDQIITANYTGTTNFQNSSETVDALCAPNGIVYVGFLTGSSSPSSIDFTGPNTETVHYLQLVRGPSGSSSRVNDSIGYVQGVISQMTVDGVTVTFVTNASHSVTATTPPTPTPVGVSYHKNANGLIDEVDVLTASGYARGVVTYGQGNVIQDILFR